MNSKESKSTQVSLNKPKCAQMYLNKINRAWICLNEPRIAPTWRYNEPESIQMSLNKPICV